MILRNQAKCRRCGDHIMSASRHSFRSCKCGAIGVDGGVDYLRRLYPRPCKNRMSDGRDCLEDTSITIERDISYAEARKYLAALIALNNNEYPKSTRTIYQFMEKQARKQPWLPVPTSLRQLREWLRKLVEYGFVEEQPLNGKIKWTVLVPMAPFAD